MLSRLQERRRIVNINMGIIYVLIGAFCFAISNAYWKKVTATIPYQIGMFYRGIFATVIFAILYFGFRQADFFKYWVVRDIVIDQEFILSIALSVFNIFGLVFFLQGLQKAPVSVVVPVSSLKLFTILTAVFVVGEVWKGNYLIAFILSTVGLFLLYYKRGEIHNAKEFEKGMLYGLASSFFWGSSYALYKFPIAWWGPLGFSLIIESVAMLFGLVLVVKDGFSNQLVSYLKAIHLKAYLILGALLVIGGLAINMSYGYLPVVVINILIIGSQIISVLIGYFIYKERLSIKQWIGLALIIASFFVVAAVS
jgi:drug/metabolite transporter (DMT)-like permease